MKNFIAFFNILDPETGYLSQKSVRIEAANEYAANIEFKKFYTNQVPSELKVGNHIDVLVKCYEQNNAS